MYIIIKKGKVKRKLKVSFGTINFNLKRKIKMMK